MQLNKAILSSYNFDCFFTLLFAQLVLTLLFCTITRDRLGNPFNVPKFDEATLKA